MKDITYFSQNVVNCFDNNIENMKVFNDLMMDTANNVYDKYSKADSNEMIRNQFNKVLGINYRSATRTERRQALRLHGIEISSIIENVLIDRMVSGINEQNMPIMRIVEDRNISLGDINYFTIDAKALLQVSKWAGGHHDIVRQKVLPGKGFSIDVSKYVIKTYASYDEFMMGKVDFAALIDLLYRSIEKYRFQALYENVMALDSYLPADMKASIGIAEATKQDILDHIEKVSATTGKDVMLVGTRFAIQKLQSTVNYNMWSDGMKDERYQNGILANWEGYECMVLNRINAEGTRDSIFTAQDNKKIYILPIDPDFKPIKRINSGDVEYFERGMDGSMQDRTMEGEVWYEEGIGIILDELYGVIIDNA